MMMQGWADQTLRENAFMDLYTPFIEKDWEVLKRNAHSLKGSSNYAGIKILANTAGELQYSAIDKKARLSSELLLKILEEGQIVYKILLKGEGGELTLTPEL
mmetsp:Transcript_39021/g.34699  ORF Transcript_39021/g.34699 Transcript_39021/m.34699 type:complete len:102 (-) Transcript_39021:1105-1410(-)